MNDKKDISTVPELNKLIENLLIKFPSTSNETHKWWSKFEYPQTFSFEVDQLLNFSRVSMFFQALHGTGGLVEDYGVDGDFVGQLSELVLSFEKLEGKLVYRALPTSVKPLRMFFSFDHGSVYVLHDSSDAESVKVRFYFVCQNNILFEKLKELSKNFLKIV